MAEEFERKIGSDYFSALVQKWDAKFPGLEVRTKGSGKRGILTTPSKEKWLS